MRGSRAIFAAIAVAGLFVLVVAIRSRNAETPSPPPQIEAKDVAPAPPAPPALASELPAPERGSGKEGYRAAAPGDAGGTLAGRVVGPDGQAVRFQELWVEWVLGETPAGDFTVRVDPEGTRWLRKTVTTDRDGKFSVAGVPARAPLRVQAGRTVLAARAGVDLLLRLP